MGLLSFKIILITKLIVRRGGVDPPRGASKHVENKRGGVELVHSMGNPRVTRAVPAPTPALNPYPWQWVRVPAGMTMGIHHILSHSHIIPFITSPATTAAPPAYEDDMATTAAAAAAPAYEDDAGDNSCPCPCQRGQRGDNGCSCSCQCQ